MFLFSYTWFFLHANEALLILVPLKIFFLLITCRVRIRSTFITQKIHFYLLNIVSSLLDTEKKISKISRSKALSSIGWMPQNPKKKEKNKYKEAKINCQIRLFFFRRRSSELSFRVLYLLYKNFFSFFF